MSTLCQRNARPHVPPRYDDEASSPVSCRGVDSSGPNGVVPWVGADLTMRPQEEFGLSLSDDTIYRALKDLGFSHVSGQAEGHTGRVDQLKKGRLGSPNEDHRPAGDAMVKIVGWKYEARALAPKQLQVV
jgi:hypothetical protein